MAVRRVADRPLAVWPTPAAGAAGTPVAPAPGTGLQRPLPPTLPQGAPVAISFTSLTKRYRAVTAVDDLSVDVQPGRITAFLGPNGSGKTTSMRALLGLTVPTAGTATIDGRRYRDVPHPMRVVGAVLDQGLHPNRTARRHLRVLALQAGVPRTRVEEMLELVGLTAAADRRVGGYSLGMRQRLALAGALIGDPAALVLDEPFNGLDPDGIWMMRAFLRTYADDGGTVFLSSHLLAEVANTADDAVIINKGRPSGQAPSASSSGRAAWLSPPATRRRSRRPWSTRANGRPHRTRRPARPRRGRRDDRGGRRPGRRSRDGAAGAVRGPRVRLPGTRARLGAARVRAPHGPATPATDHQEVPS